MGYVDLLGRYWEVTSTFLECSQGNPHRFGAGVQSYIAPRILSGIGREFRAEKSRALASERAHCISAASALLWPQPFGRTLHLPGPECPGWRQGQGLLPMAGVGTVLSLLGKVNFVLEGLSCLLPAWYFGLSKIVSLKLQV